MQKEEHEHAAAHAQLESGEHHRIHGAEAQAERIIMLEVLLREASKNMPEETHTKLFHDSAAAFEAEKPDHQVRMLA